MKSKQNLKMSNQKAWNEREYSILGANKKCIQKVGYKISLDTGKTGHVQEGNITD
jgi:hypothetical protein